MNQMKFQAAEVGGLRRRLLSLIDRLAAKCGTSAPQSTSIFLESDIGVWDWESLI